jgi:hypothetical protein
MTYFLDVATGAVTPLVDFSDLEITPRDFFFMFGRIDPESDLASDTPRAAAVAPDGRSVYILHQTYVLGLSIATLPPVPGSLPTLFFRSEAEIYSRLPILTHGSVSSDGRYLLLEGYLFTLAADG